ncbi:hypothetical protein IQ264_27135 [Phormidium sp. LEGE 05292]|uniref:hypothetical protein n=1 Tax=[Phormidium] sp. LEGE 05292 TaxID=767427 RepID=UPI001881BC28|nr:hypothetical protein [Phormidium sp. LEGE 05292]MBE9229084.1 hypothetical protein [Phormidium sp. LEGE 05292]
MGKEEFKVTKAAKSLTISYFAKDLNIINKRYNLNKKIRTAILGYYGIETILGYWIPKQYVDDLKEQQKPDDLEKFQNDLLMLKEKLDDESKKVEIHWVNLKKAGKINQDEPNPKESFKINFINTINDSILLKRIYYRYAITELPYLIEQDKEIKLMYQSLIQTCDCENKREICQKNDTIKAVMKAVCEAHSTKNLNPILNLK